MVTKNYPIRCEISLQEWSVIDSVFQELEALRFLLTGFGVKAIDCHELEFATLLLDIKAFLIESPSPPCVINTDVIKSFATSVNLFTKHFYNSTNNMEVSLFGKLRIIELRLSLLYYSLVFDFNCDDIIVIEKV